MSDNTIPSTTTPFTRPTGEIQLLPQDFTFSYAGHVGDRDAFEVHVTDPKLGPLSLLLTTAGAMHIAEHLLGMVADVDELRAQWDTANPKGDNK